MDAGFFRGTSSEQDRRFGDKNQKLMKTLKFADVLKSKIDMKKIKVDILRPWIAQRILEIAGVDDDVVAGYATEMLEKERFPDPKLMQINLTGFMTAKFARKFMEELWGLLVSAQSNDLGIPQAILDDQKARLDQDHAEKRRIVEQIKQRLPHLNKATLDDQERTSPRTTSDAAGEGFNADRLVEVKPEAAPVGKVSTSDKNSAASPTESSNRSNQQNVATKAAASLTLLSSTSATNSAALAAVAPVKKVEKQSLAKMVEKLQKTTTSAKGIPDRPKFGRNILTERENSHYRRYRRRRTGRRSSSSYSTSSSRSRSTSSSPSSRSRSPPTRRRRYNGASGRQRRRSSTRSPSPIDFRRRHGSRDRYGRPRQRPSRIEAGGNDEEDARAIAQRHQRNRDREYRLDGRSNADKDSRRDNDRQSRDPRRSERRRPRTPSPASSSSSSSASSRRSSVERHRRRPVPAERKTSAVEDRVSRTRRDTAIVEDKRTASVDNNERPRQKKTAKPASPIPTETDRNSAKARSRRSDAHERETDVKNGHAADDKQYRKRRDDSRAAEKSSKARNKSRDRNSPAAVRRSRSSSHSRSRSFTPPRPIHRDEQSRRTKSTKETKERRSPRNDAVEMKTKSPSVSVHRDKKDDRRRGIADHNAETDSFSVPAPIQSKKQLRSEYSVEVDEKRSTARSEKRSVARDSDKHDGRRDDSRRDDRSKAKESKGRKRYSPSPDDKARAPPSSPPPPPPPPESRVRRRKSDGKTASPAVEARSHRRNDDDVDGEAKQANRNKRPKTDDGKLSRESVSSRNDKVSAQDGTVSSSSNAENAAKRRHRDHDGDANRRDRHRHHRRHASPSTPKDDTKNKSSKHAERALSPSYALAVDVMNMDKLVEVAGTNDESSWAVEADMFLKGELGASSNSRNVSNPSSSRQSRKPSPPPSVHTHKTEKAEPSTDSERRKRTVSPTADDTVQNPSKRERSVSPQTPQHSPPTRTPTSSPPPFLLLQASEQRERNATADKNAPASDREQRITDDNTAEAERQECIRAQQQLRSSFVTPSPTKTFMPSSSTASSDVSNNDRYRRVKPATTPTTSDAGGAPSDSVHRHDKYRQHSSGRQSSSRNAEVSTMQSPVGAGRNVSPSSSVASRVSSAEKTAHYRSGLERRRSSSRLDSTDAEGVADNEADIPGEGKISPKNDDAVARENVQNERDGSRSRSGSHNSLEELKKQEWYQQRLKQGEDKQRERSERRQRKLERKLERQAARQEHKQQKRLAQKQEASDEEAAE